MSKKLEKEKKDEKSKIFFVFWSIGFCCSILNILILLDSKWIITNRKKSMSLAIGTVYWKGLFVQCMSRQMNTFQELVYSISILPTVYINEASYSVITTKFRGY